VTESDEAVTRSSPASGLYSNVVVNLTAAEAVALGDLLFDVAAVTPDGARACEKVERAAERACIPWAERGLAEEDDPQ
jgi:hypothetical protein